MTERSTQMNLKKKGLLDSRWQKNTESRWKKSEARLTPGSLEGSMRAPGELKSEPKSLVHTLETPPDAVAVATANQAPRERKWRKQQGVGGEQDLPL